METDVEVEHDSPLCDPAVVSALQDEIIAMVKAWADRGIPPSDSAQFIAATGHVMLARFGSTLGQVIVLLAEQWTKHGGTL